MTPVSKKQWTLMGCFLAAIVALDQITKALVRANIPYGGELRLLPGIVRLTWVENTGAAFSMFAGMRWLFLALVLVYFGGVYWLLRRKIIGKLPELWCLAAIGGGAVGNAIDRAFTGHVTDMIEPLFMDFAVFNVADIFITCGAAALVVYLLFFGRRGGKEEQSAEKEAEEPK